MPFRDGCRRLSVICHAFIHYVFMTICGGAQMKIQFTRPLTITSTSVYFGQGCPQLVPRVRLLAPQLAPHTGQPVGITYIKAII